MKNDSIIFDVDGTLWNATQAIAKGWNKALKELRISDKKIKPSDIASVAGKPFKQCLEILLPEVKGDYENLAKTIKTYAQEEMENEGGIIYSGVVEGIKTLSKFYKIFLVSNCGEWYLNFFLKFSNIEKYLQYADCHGKSGLTKDKMITKVKKDYRLKNPVFIGDTDDDQEAAKSAKVDFIYVSYGFGELKNVHSVPSFDDLVLHFMKNKK